MAVIQQIQEKIAKQLSDFRDVENVCEAFPHLYGALDDYLQAMKTDQVTKKVIFIYETRKY